MEFIERFVRQAGGVGPIGGPCSARLVRQLIPYLTAECDEEDGSFSETRQVADLHGEFSAWERETQASDDGPEVRLARWPRAAAFGLFLSHDVDVIYERELFRMLGGINRMRRKVAVGDWSGGAQAFRGLMRALVNPKVATRDFETMLEIERRHGFRLKPITYCMITVPVGTAHAIRSKIQRSMKSRVCCWMQDVS